MRKETRNSRDYTMQEWWAMPRDYRFVIEVDVRNVIERDACAQIQSALIAHVAGVDRVEVMPGHTNPKVRIKDCFVKLWDKD